MLDIACITRVSRFIVPKANKENPICRRTVFFLSACYPTPDFLQLQPPMEMFELVKHESRHFRGSHPVTLSISASDDPRGCSLPFIHLTLCLEHVYEDPGFAGATLWVLHRIVTIPLQTVQPGLQEVVHSSIKTHISHMDIKSRRNLRSTQHSISYNRQQLIPPFNVFILQMNN